MLTKVYMYDCEKLRIHSPVSDIIIDRLFLVIPLNECFLLFKNCEDPPRVKGPYKVFFRFDEEKIRVSLLTDWIKSREYS